jgi:hypothetical protein
LLKLLKNDWTIRQSSSNSMPINKDLGWNP